MNTNVHINAVVFRDGDAWVIQGVEYDIAAHVSKITDLPRAFERALVANVVVSAHLGRAPLEGVPPAPQQFRDMLDRAEQQIVAPRAKASLRERPDIEIWLAETA